MKFLNTLLLVLVISSCVLSGGFYNETLASKLADLCGIAYCPEDSVYSWTCIPCRRWSDVKLISVISQPKYSVFGFVASMEEGRVFVFEGTQDLEDVLIDLQFAKTVPYRNHPTARVHDGFWKAYTSVRDDLLVLVREGPTFCTGHSLGAAMATLLAIDMQETLNKSCILYNMGSPRVGNKAFGKLFSSDTISHRITHWNDPVPHLPPLLLDFYHIPDEIWYNKDWSSYTHCTQPESRLCSDSRAIAFNIPDHRNYFNKSITLCRDLIKNI